MGFTTIDFIILVAYLAAVLFAGLHFSKKDAKDLVEHPEKMQQYCIKYGYKY